MVLRLKDGMSGGTRLSMTELVEYGIQTEESDIRAHVSVVNRAIYAFPTIKGLEAIKKADLPLRTAGQPGVEGITAEGWTIPFQAIDGIRTLRFYSWRRWHEFNENMTTSEKGKLAVQCVLDCMKKGRFPFWINATEDERENIQIKGVDILIFCHKKIQVKCDWRCGHGPLGTGNLFLQKSERNPLKRT